MRRMRGLFRRGAAITSAAVVAASLLTVAAEASPQSSSSASTAQEAPAADPSTAAAGRAVTVTLITGDRVHVAAGPDGRPAVTVDAVPGLLSSFSVEQAPDGDIFVYPSGAVAAILDGTVDRALFNVTDLVAQGHDDAGSNRLPVIIDFEDDPSAATLAHRADALPASDATLTLPRVGFAAVSVDKAAAHEFWPAIATSSARAERRISHVWLDEPVHAVLDESVPLIGAPEAWEAGFDGTGTTVAVIDTGIDGSHPDLAGEIDAAQSFVPGEPPDDLNGHGTHVASTVTGSGAASGGQYVGVAPGARLVNSKVLNAGGGGLESWVIAGMEWAVEQGVDIASMSLGGGPTDGTDPMSQAVNELSASSDTLFVIAAGNFGGNETVATPGAADAALTVGAFDKQDQLAPFSSRGPRVGDGGLKPEITGPGVDIVAARAAGTFLGEPVDDFYTRLSGTSMATPHVSGAAAIVAQQHPDWTGEQIKDALISTAATSDAYTVYEQGGGRVDVARVTRQSVHATGKADFGLVPYPQDGLPPITHTVTYTNGGDAEVALDLALDVAPAPAEGVFELSADTVTVPAGGEAIVTLTVDPTAGDPARYSGYLTASAEGIGLVTAVGYEKEEPSFNLTVRVIGRTGATPRQSLIGVQNLADPAIFYTIGGTFLEDEASFRVPAGTYGVQGAIFSADPDGTGFFYSTDLFGSMEFEVDEDVTVTIDARQAEDFEPVITGEPRPTEPTQITQTIGRRSTNGSLTLHAFLASRTDSSGRFGAIPIGAPNIGELYSARLTTLRQPLLRAEVLRPAPSDVFTLTPTFSARFEGSRRLPLVYADAGAPEDYEGISARGKVVLVRSDNANFTTVAATAAEQGAAALIVARRTPGVVIAFVQESNTLPVLGTTYDEGQRLLTLLQRGPVTMKLTGVAESTYTHTVNFADDTGISGPPFTVERAEMARIVDAYHADRPATRSIETMHSFVQPWLNFSFRAAVDIVRPVTRTDYVMAGPDHQWWQFLWTGPTFFDSVQMLQPISSYRVGQRVRTSWVKAPNHPSSYTDAPCNFCRSETGLLFSPNPSGDADPTHYGFGLAQTTATYFRNGQLIPSPGDLLVPQPATYRIEHDTVFPPSPGLALAPEMHTAWTFRSQAPSDLEVPDCELIFGAVEGCAALPVILLGYDVPLDPLNRAPAGGAFAFTIRTDRAKGFEAPGDVTGLRVWASFNDGATWRPAASVAPGSDGTWEVVVQHPPAGASNGYVALRVQASDAAGNRTNQTILRAYALAVAPAIVVA